MYTVIRDTREQNGWNFIKSTNCAGTIDGKLPTGDYTLQGYEDIFTIERKGSSGEFAKNVVEKRFARELERMEGFTHPFMILEFNMGDILNFPQGSGIPIKCWSQLKINPYFLLKCLIAYQVKFKTKIILAGEHGQDVASSLFKRVIEVANEKPKRVRRTTRKA
jgi:hypothetical protein